MTPTHRHRILVAALAITLAPIRSHADEPKPAAKKAVDAKPDKAEPKADKPAEAKKEVDARDVQLMCSFNSGFHSLRSSTGRSSPPSSTSFDKSAT